MDPECDRHKLDMWACERFSSILLEFCSNVAPFHSTLLHFTLFRSTLLCFYFLSWSILLWQVG